MIKRLVSVLTILLFLTGCQSSYVAPEVNSVFYEIFVDSFYDSDEDGHGDLQGVIEKLDYIQKDLGATGIWLMPVHPSESYHKYDVIDYKAIDPRYGTMEDMDLLIEEMNKRDMDLILDLVINHTSNQHPWFLAAIEEFESGNCIQYCDYYNLSKDPIANAHQHPSKIYFESGFAESMPDLNLDNSDVRKEIEDIVKFWVDKNISGFRLDATTHYYDNNLEKNIEYLKTFSDYAYSLNEDLIIVGEAWTDASIVKPMYESNISFFNFSIAQNNGRLVKSINSKRGYDLARYIQGYNEDIKSYNDKAVDSVFFSNHDHGRSASYFANHIEKQKLAASTYLLMPGNVYIYYGEEIGMIGSGRDENKRLAMQWGSETGMTQSPQDQDYTGELTMNLKDQKKDQDSLFNHYKQVISLRNSYPEIARESTKAIDMQNQALFALQYEDIIVVHNFSDEEKQIPAGYTIVEKTLGGKKTGDGIKLEAYKTVILKAE